MSIMKTIILSQVVVAVLAAAIARGAAEPAPVASSLFQSVVTEANLDVANTAEFPPHPAAKGGFGVAASRTEGLLGALHVRGPLSPHGSWLTDETDDSQRFLRLAFKDPLPVGTVIGAGGDIGYLKAEAPFPGDVTQDEHWVAVPTTEGQAGERVVVFPPEVVTRALRFAFHDPLPQGGKSRSGFGGALILQARLHNLTPEATAFASSQPAGGANVVEATRVQNLVAGGSWSAAPKQDVSPEHPEWVVLSWPEAKSFSGVGFYNAFAKVLEIDALNAAETGHPAAAPEAAWTKVGTLTWPIWWRPAYTDAFVPFAAPVTTRALRVRITHPLTNEDQDIAHTSRGNRRTVRLGGVMAFANLADAPVPPRPKVAAEPAPIVIPLTMPYDGKLAVAIDSAEGRRVRNLVAEADRSSGQIVERWDGRDDAGRTVAPGTYTVKAITHRPLHLTYQATVNCSGNPPWWKSGSWGDQAGPGSWLSDHAPPNDVTSIGERIFVGAVIAESGHTILACDLDGNKVWGGKWLETAGAGYLTNDGKKVYSAGEGGWIGDRLFIHEIDPLTFKWRRVTQLDFDTGNTPGGGVSGIAARDGKLYVAFNRPPLPWLRSAIATANVDEKNTTVADSPHGGDLLGLLRTRGDIPAHGAWKAAQSSDPAQHLRIAFKTAQPVGTLVTPDAVDVSALRADVPHPGDVTRDEQWIPFTKSAGAIHCYVAPAGLTTRALRFTNRKAADDGKVWQSQLGGALLLSRRFTNAMAGAAVTASAGQATADGRWTAVTEQMITRSSPPTLVVSWPEAKRFRGLGFLNAFAKRIAVDAYTGAADVDPAKAPETAWTNLGEIAPAVRWRPAYRDDYFDAGKDVTARGIRLRVVEPWVNEDGDIAAITGGKPTRAALGGLVVFQHLGDDPAQAEVPTQRISVADIATGKWERHIAVPAPQFPHFDAAGNLVLVSGRQVARMSLADGALTPIVKEGLAEPRGIALDAAGNLCVADAGPKVVRVFSPEGKPLRVIGTPGGRQVGAYDPNRFGNLHGIAIDGRGRLWVAEPDFQPKRTSLWDVETGKFLKEFIGPAQYGGGGFLDPQDKSRFYYTGMEFAIDWRTGGWQVKNILTRSQPAFRGGHTDHPVYLNGKQYMVNDPGVQGTNGQLLLVGEFRKDRVVPLSAAGNAELWGPFTSDPALAELVAGKLLNTLSFVWADADGDGLPQPGEVTISPQGVRLNCTYWPTFVNQQLMVQMGGRLLQPAGYSPCGAPVYQPFREEARLPAFPAENIYATAVDAKGRVVVNGRPVLAINPDGKVDWSYPQQWVGVHDSHHAASPQPGQLIGGLGFVGQAEVPGVGETLMLSGNKGEWYLFTADGLLAATLWHDYRKPGVATWNFPKAERGMPLDGVTVGEEHFGGGYTRTGDGKYYLIAGHNHNSLAELTGLESLQRQGTTVTLTPDDITACEAWTVRQRIAQAQKESPRIITAAAASAPVTSDGNLQEWAETPFTPIGNRGSFAVRADANHLYLAYQVDSGGMPRNGGDDVKMLFKTGDSVDLQIGADAKANPARTAPVPGDQRLLITLFEGKPVGVLYQHRVPGTPQAERTPFASPWRTEYVDKIVRLDPANIGVARTPKGYAVEATVPLALLGLTPQPGVSYKADFGILTADASGVATQVRSYWANPSTGVVSDVPSEIMLTPGLWGTLIFPGTGKPQAPSANEKGTEQ